MLTLLVTGAFSGCGPLAGRPTDSKEILHNSVYRREPLHVGGRREASHLALPLTRRVVGNLGSIVRVLTACRAPPLRDRPPHVAEEKTGPHAAACQNGSPSHSFSLDVCKT